jgi:hypothetical protein
MHPILKNEINEIMYRFKGLYGRLQHIQKMKPIYATAAHRMLTSPYLSEAAAASRDIGFPEAICEIPIKKLQFVENFIAYYLRNSLELALVWHKYDATIDNPTRRFVDCSSTTVGAMPFWCKTEHVTKRKDEPWLRILTPEQVIFTLKWYEKEEYEIALKLNDLEQLEKYLQRWKERNKLVIDLANELYPQSGE